jgi:hypothetical protein
MSIPSDGNIVAPGQGALISLIDMLIRRLGGCEDGQDALRGQLAAQERRATEHAIQRDNLRQAPAHDPIMGLLHIGRPLAIVKNFSPSTRTVLIDGTVGKVHKGSIWLTPTSSSASNSHRSQSCPTWTPQWPCYARRRQRY